MQEWNPPTETVLAPGQTVSYGLRFFVAPSLRDVDATLAEHKRPVAIGVAGYVLPTDMAGRLLLSYPAPVQSIVSEPAGAVKLQDDGPVVDRRWQSYTLHGEQWGRARLVVTYADGTVQSIAYRTIKPEQQAAADMGHFSSMISGSPTRLIRSIGHLRSSASTMHRKTDHAGVACLHRRLSDKAGAGSCLAAAMKEYVRPDAAEVKQLESFVDETLWGHLQDAEGEHKYGVHKSLFFYQPDQLPADYYAPDTNWKSWTSLSKKDAADVGRSYNYPHVVAAYWALYRIARNTTGLVPRIRGRGTWIRRTRPRWRCAVWRPTTRNLGKMEGTVFLQLLQDLKAEGHMEQATALEAMMRERADHWKTEVYPFGSEMPWDSTGKEEVYDWTRYFGYAEKAQVTLDAILSYTPVIPSWAYNGSSRRYWDFLYGGKYSQIERQLHHYGSGLNAIPLLTEYRAHPEDLHLLRAGYGGVIGPLSNIDQKGFASAAFHSFPDRMAFDPYTGDYGPNFFGHAMNTGVYLSQGSSLWMAGLWRQCSGGGRHGADHCVGLRTKPPVPRATRALAHAERGAVSVGRV